MFGSATMLRCLRDAHSSLEIRASSAPDDYEVEESPYWPPPLPPKLSPEEKERIREKSRGIKFFIVMPCWLAQATDR
jgi:hypothetical protein